MTLTKRILTSLAFTTFGITAAHADMTSAILANSALGNGLVAYYSFDASGAAGLNNQATAVGSNYSGTLVNATMTGTGVTTGYAGNTLSGLGNSANFTGDASSLLNVAIGSATLGQSFSIGMWFYGNVTDATSARRYLFEDSTSGSQYNISAGTSAGIGSSATSLGIGQYNNSQSAYTDTVSMNAWHFIVQTFTANGANSTMTTFIDGTQTHTFTSTNGQPSFTGLNIGNSRPTTSRPWEGQIDNVVLYNRTLTAGDVTALYAVPEPSTYGLLGAGALAAAAVVRRRRKA